MRGFDGRVPRREGAVDRVETPHRIVRQSQCVVLDKLATMLSEFRSLIGRGSTIIDGPRSFIRLPRSKPSKPPNPYQAALLSMVKRPLPALKMVRLDLAAGVVESFIVAA